MKDDSDRWDEYVRLQRELGRSARVDDRAAGYEKALHALLTDAGSISRDGAPIDTGKLRASAERNERRRRVLRLREAGSLQDLGRAHADACPHGVFHARIELGRIVRAAGPKDLALIVRLAGADADATTPGMSPAAFRKRLERFRMRLAA